MADDRVIVEATIDPLRAADLLREVDGVTRLRDGIDLEPTPVTRPDTSRCGSPRATTRCC